MITSSAQSWLRAIYAEARRAQDDPQRDQAFQIWKDNYLRTEKASRSLKTKRGPNANASGAARQPKESVDAQSRIAGVESVESKSVE